MLAVATEDNVSIQVINILAILLSPVIAVGITLWWQRRKETSDRKHNLFMTMMAQRKSIPPSYDLVKAINLIEVVFADSPDVLKLWHEYFDLLVSSKTEVEIQQRERKYLDLLHAMAKALDYEKIKQTDIDRFYFPVAHGDQAQITAKMQQELLRVLENTERFVVVRKEQKEQGELDKVKPK
jgi:hypothetical protein